MGIPAGQGVDASGIPPQGDQATAVISGQITAVGPTEPFAFRGPMNIAIYADINTSLTTTAGSTAATVASATGLAAGAAINSKNVPPGTTIGALAGTAATLAIPPITIPGTTDGVTANLQIPASIGGPLMATLVGAAVTGPNIPSGTTVSAVIQETVAPTDLSPGTPGIIQLSNKPTAMTPFQNQPQWFTFARTGNAITVTGADANATFTGAGVEWVGSVQLERSFDGGSTWIVANIGGSGALAQYSAGTPVSLTFGEPEKQVLYRLNCTAYTSGTINFRFSQTGSVNETLSIPLIY
jgi:hypothetical protein